MGIIRSVSKVFVNKKEEKEPKVALLEFLGELEKLEARLWGVIFTEVKSGEEKIIEDVNHLIYAFNSSSHEKIRDFLKNKDFANFKKDVENLRKDFLILKDRVKKRDILKNLITKYTIKLVDEQNYPKLETIFLLEKQLYSVLDRQDEEFSKIIQDVKKLSVSEFDKIEKFMDILKNLRTILAGHLDHHDLWEEERQGFSNLSNILHSLKKAVLQIS